MKIKKLLSIFLCSLTIVFSACKNDSTIEKNNSFESNQSELQKLLDTQTLNDKQRYSIINQMANNYLAIKDYQGLILFLTDWVEENPNDMYSSYWLLMTAYAYLSNGAEPVAEYYFNRILNQCQDLLVKGTSVHFMCLQNLIQISTTPTNRIKYFNELINRFPQNVNTTELYLRLALEYQKDSQWDQALKTYALFLQQPDASVIQIPGEPDAYKKARHFVDFNNSSKDWTFETLPELEAAVKKAISHYNWKTLDSYKAKVNFFTMSWKQDENDVNSQEETNMASWALGQRIRYSETLDESSTPNEAYLRTWGWNNYVSVWYLYFRKVDFPVDPDIHGTWEWAGIYLGNKL